MRWILPVKMLQFGKSRLHEVGIARDELVLAMLLDTLEAVLESATGEVLIVSPDPRVGHVAQGYGVQFLSDDGDLNAAVTAGRVRGICAALLPDVPAVTAQDLRDALVGADSGFVPDAEGTGTTLAFGADLVPRFGPGSAAAYAADGLPRLMAGPGLRRDVDTAEDLQQALAIGVGRHTGALMKKLRGRPAVRTGP